MVWIDSCCISFIKTGVVTRLAHGCQTTAAGHGPRRISPYLSLGGCPLRRQVGPTSQRRICSTISVAVASGSLVAYPALAGEVRPTGRDSRFARNIPVRCIRCQFWDVRWMRGPFDMLYTTGSGQDDVLDLSTEEREEQFRRCSRRWWSAGKWYQYRLSTLMFITALLATIMGGVRVWYDQREQEHLVRRMGGRPCSRETGILNFDLRRVYSADFSGTSITDSDLQTLCRLPDLEELDLTGTAITDQGLEYVESLPKLLCDDLTNTHISAGTIAKARAKCPRLTFGSLIRCSVFSW